MTLLGRIGGGLPPGYMWRVEALTQVGSEKNKELDNQAQRQHLVEQVQELARSEQPSSQQTVDVKAIENFFELRDKGGVLNGINIRLFFGVHHGTRTIVVLGLCKKQNNGPTPQGDIVRMRKRWRDALVILDSKHAAAEATKGKTL